MQPSTLMMLGAAGLGLWWYSKQGGGAGPAVSGGPSSVSASFVASAYGITDPNLVAHASGLVWMARSIFGRDPSQTELLTWLGQLEAGFTAPQLATAWLQSPEAVARTDYTSLVVATWVSLYGRQPTAQEVSTWNARLVSRVLTPFAFVTQAIQAGQAGHVLA